MLRFADYLSVVDTAIGLRDVSSGFVTEFLDGKRAPPGTIRLVHFGRWCDSLASPRKAAPPDRWACGDRCRSAYHEHSLFQSPVPCAPQTGCFRARELTEPSAPRFSHVPGRAKARSRLPRTHHVRRERFRSYPFEAPRPRSRRMRHG